MKETKRCRIVRCSRLTLLGAVILTAVVIVNIFYYEDVWNPRDVQAVEEEDLDIADFIVDGSLEDYYEEEVEVEQRIFGELDANEVSCDVF